MARSSPRPARPLHSIEEWNGPVGPSEPRSRPAEIPPGLRRQRDVIRSSRPGTAADDPAGDGTGRRAPAEAAWGLCGFGSVNVLKPGVDSSGGSDAAAGASGGRSGAAGPLAGAFGAPGSARATTEAASGTG